MDLSALIDGEQFTLLATCVAVVTYVEATQLPILREYFKNHLREGKTVQTVRNKIILLDSMQLVLTALAVLVAARKFLLPFILPSEFVDLLILSIVFVVTVFFFGFHLMTNGQDIYKTLRHSR